MNAGSRAHLRFLAALALALAALLVPAQSSFAEGSANFNTGAETQARNGLMGYSLTNAPYWHGYTVLRVYARAGETIQMGSSAMGLGGSADIRLYAPGTSFTSPTEPGWRASFPTDPVFGMALLDCATAQPGAGRIASRAEEKAGPLPNAGGYTPCQYTATADGIYAVLMTPYALNSTVPASTIANPSVTTAQQSTISIWDVTVRAGGAVQSGRVFTDIFNVGTPIFSGTPSPVSAFAYSPAGHVYRVQLFAPNGVAWDLAVNGAGVVDATTGQPLFASFKWFGGAAGYPPTKEPEFKEALAPQMAAGDEAVDSRWPLFLQSPAPIAIGGPGGLAETRGYATEPWAPEGGLANALSFTGASGAPGMTSPGAGGTVHIDAPPLQGLAYTVAIDLDGNGSFGGGGDVEGAGVVSATGNSFAWNGRDAAGAVVPCGTYSYEARSTLPTMHVLQADTENEGGIEIERLTLPGDPLLGEPKAAAYNETDPYQGTAVTNTSPSAVAEGTSGPSFHGWSASSGHTAFVDTWVPVRQTTGVGTFTVACPQAGGGQKPGARTPPTSRPPHHKRGHKAGKPNLVVRKTASTAFARPSSVVGYTITVRNKGDGAARRVEVCDEPPSGLTILRSEPGASGKGSTCWRLRSLVAGGKRVFRVTAQIAARFGRGTARNLATVSAANVKGVQSDGAAVRVKPLPNTACGSRRQLSPPRVDLRC